MILLGTGWGEGLAAFDRLFDLASDVVLVAYVVVMAGLGIALAIGRRPHKPN